MKNTIKTFWAFAFLILSSCIFGGGGDSKKALLTLASESEPAASERRNERSYSSQRGRCEESRECVNICEDIYEEDYDGDETEDPEERVETCIELGYNIVQHFDRIYEILDSPSSSGLRNIETKAFEKFLDVSVKPWIELMEKASRSEAQALLAWIAQDTKVSSAIEEAYEGSYEDVDRYAGVTELLEELEGGSGNLCSKLCERVQGTTIRGTANFWTLIEPRKASNIQYNTTNPSAVKIVCDLWSSACTGDERKTDGGEPECGGLSTDAPHQMNDICPIATSQ